MKMLSVLKHELLSILGYSASLAVFSYVIFSYPAVEWKLFAGGMVLCSILCISNFIISKIILTRYESESSPRLESITKVMAFRSQFFAIVPMGIVFYISAIFSLVSPSSFLATHTCIILLLAPLPGLYSVYQRYPHNQLN